MHPLLFLIQSFSALILASCAPSQIDSLNPERQTYQIQAEGKKFYIELADTPQLSELGLMHRKKLHPDHGMLFFFRPPRRVAFWMKNTYIPLSVAFLDQSGVIMEIRDLHPLDERAVVSSSDSVCFALEMEQSWFKKNNITIGSVVDLSQLPQLDCDTH